MFRLLENFRQRKDGRKGASMVMIAVLMGVFLLLAAMTVDYAYMGLVQTELRIATDAAAKAGAEALSRTESVSQAQDAAITLAAENRVGKQSLQIRPDDVIVGKLEYQHGSWEFVESLDRPNAVQVRARTGGTALHPAVPLLFGSVLGIPSFRPHALATAGQQDVAVCLCLDRSGSMLFDMSGVDYVYPKPNPLLNNYRDEGEMMRYHTSPPHPSRSRWAILADTVDLFLEEAGEFNPPPRVGLVTWGSDYTNRKPNNTTFKKATTNVQMPPHLSSDWEGNVVTVKQAISHLGSRPMMGATNLSAGLDESVRVLTDPAIGLFSSKVVILITDGLWNEGRNPIQAAYEARDAGIVVHTITMLTAYQHDVAQVAQITGGRYFRTSNEAELVAAFQELARSLPIVLVD